MRWIHVSGVALAAGLLVQAMAGAQAPLRVGVAMQDITPPLGYRMAGYFYERLATAVHDPLMAKAIVFRQGDVQAALVECDLCHLSPAAVAQARALAAQKTGIPADHIIVCATHTHTGPAYYGTLVEHLHRLALAANNGADPTQKIDYPDLLARRIAAAIIEAQAAAAESSIAIGSTQQESLAFNRRFFMQDGTVGWNAGKKNPKITRPAGPIDPQVAALSVTRPGQPQPAAVLTNFALHLDTVGGTEYSADMAGYLQNALRQSLKSPELVSIFLQGTCGDINHIDVSTDRPQKGHVEAERIGVALAGHVAAALREARPVEKPSLAAMSANVVLPVQQFTPDEVAEARSTFAKIHERKLPFLVGVKASKIVNVYDRYLGKPIVAQVQAIRLSADTAIVALPSEVFVELGLDLKKRSPFARTMVVELSGESFGYIPTRRAYAEGNYEPTNSVVECGGGEKLIDAAVGLLEKLR